MHTSSPRHNIYHSPVLSLPFLFLSRQLAAAGATFLSRLLILLPAALVIPSIPPTCATSAGTRSEKQQAYRMDGWMDIVPLNMSEQSTWVSHLVSPTSPDHLILLMLLYQVIPEYLNSLYLGGKVEAKFTLLKSPENPKNAFLCGILLLLHPDEQ